MNRLLAFVLLIGFASPPSSATEPLFVKSVNGWCVCDTPHFTVWSMLSQEQTRETATCCEQLRGELCDVWFAGMAKPIWRDRCVVALHADAAAYASAVGQPGTRTVGCTTLQVDRGRVTFRRIDLRCDRPNWRSSVLPHELTHAVLSDRLGGRPLPLWADEGLAVLSEPLATRQKRDDALLKSIARGAVFQVSDLLRMKDQPATTYRDGFYGQCALLVALLIERKSPADFLDFLARSDAIGNDAALKECYGMAGTGEFERLWQAKKNAASPGHLIEATGRAAFAARLSSEQAPVFSGTPSPRAPAENAGS